MGKYQYFVVIIEREQTMNSINYNLQERIITSDEEKIALKLLQEIKDSFDDKTTILNVFKIED